VRRPTSAPSSAAPSMPAPNLSDRMSSALASSLVRFPEYTSVGWIPFHPCGVSHPVSLRQKSALIGA